MEQPHVAEASRGKQAALILRVGAAFAFLYPPIDAIFDPYSWLGYFPGFIDQIAQHFNIPSLVQLHAFGVIEVVIGLWILSGKRIFWPSFVATLMLIAIVFFNLGDFEIVFRDLSIATITIALAVMNAPRRDRT